MLGRTPYTDESPAYYDEGKLQRLLARTSATGIIFILITVMGTANSMLVWKGTGSYWNDWSRIINNF